MQFFAISTFFLTSPSFLGDNSNTTWARVGGWGWEDIFMMWAGLKISRTLRTDIIFIFFNLTETTSSVNSSIGDGMYGNLDDFTDPSDVEIKDEQDNILEVFDEYESNKEDEGYDPKHLASPDDEFSQKDVLWDPRNLETPDDAESEQKVLIELRDHSNITLA